MHRIYLEIGDRRTFACALDWPGWCRSGKGEEAALEALSAYASRYGAVASEAGVDFSSPDELEVVERLKGSGTTDFGAPGHIPEADYAPLDAQEALRQSSLLAASWTVFDRVVENAPAELRKGPRGGGRDRDAIVEHVLGAETSYARQIGLRLDQPEPGDLVAIEAHRDAILEVLSAGGDPPEKGWPARYALRRFTWHVLDHAWEVEDRARPPEETPNA